MIFSKCKPRYRGFFLQLTNFAELQKSGIMYSTCSWSRSSKVKFLNFQQNCYNAASKLCGSKSLHLMQTFFATRKGLKCHWPCSLFKRSVNFVTDNYGRWALALNNENLRYRKQAPSAIHILVSGEILRIFWDSEFSHLKLIRRVVD
jgi:hypothetical protein